MNQDQQIAEPCGACGQRVELRSGPGRVTTYRGRQLFVPADLAIRTCVLCNAEWMNRAELKVYAAEMEKQLERGRLATAQAPAPLALQVRRTSAIDSVIYALARIETRSIVRTAEALSSLMILLQTTRTTRTTNHAKNGRPVKAA